MAQIQTSVIIPTYNNWGLLRACLKSLAQHLPENTEIIVADNGSTDITPQVCAALGAQLFGGRFRYELFPENRNFGPACNWGAQAAAGEYLLFLNNDTEALPGFYGPLLQDFRHIPKLGATGPLLLYPETPPLGRTVQHLGIAVTPARRLLHLYEGIPAASPLARQRRFFQAITAACLCMPRELFLQAGMFEPGYVNGFEDVDLCVKLGRMGYKMTVNPDAAIIHYQGQTAGRHSKDGANSILFRERCRDFLLPDWHELVSADGLAPGINDWLELLPRLTPALAAELEREIMAAAPEKLAAIITAQPFFEPAWEALAPLLPPAERREFCQAWQRLLHGTAPLMAMYAAAQGANRPGDATAVFRCMLGYGGFLRGYETACAIKEEEARGIGCMERAYDQWRQNLPEFAAGAYASFMTRLWAIAMEMRHHLDPFSTWAYAGWSYNANMPARARELARLSRPAAISILMPVYNPEPAHLREAVDSVLAQSHGNWELCVADDASTDPAIRPILEEYAARDSRIKVFFREKNGNIAAAANSALALASHPYAALLDQDDLLAPDALAFAAAAIEKHPGAMLIYSDEDKLHESGEYCMPYFKNDQWDMQLLMGQNFVNHLGIYQTKRLREIGGFREGYEGAQDYDMLLRFVSGLPGEAIIHIPHVLYHWRAHEDSTSLSLQAKSGAMLNSLRALQDWADRHRPGAVAEDLPDTVFHRLVFPLPEPLPSAAIICDAREMRRLPPQFFNAWASPLPHEFILAVSHAQKDAGLAREAPDHWRILASDEPAATMWNWAAQQTDAQVLGFVSAHVLPVNGNWLNEVITSLWQPQTGALGGRLQLPDQEADKIADGGWLAMADGGLSPVLVNASREEGSYFGWSLLSRTVLTVNGSCVFTKAERWRQHGGCRAECGAAPLEDYCLRLSETGQKVIWQPEARFALRKPASPRMRDAALKEINGNWHGRFRPNWPNLLMKRGGLSLCPDV